MLTALETLKVYQDAADHLLSVSDKTALVTATRMLAAYVGHYQLRYGPIRATALIEVDKQAATPGQVADRAEGLRVLASALTVGALSSTGPE
jgi:hypothetical protein